MGWMPPRAMFRLLMAVTALLGLCAWVWNLPPWAQEKPRCGISMSGWTANTPAPIA